MPIISSTRAFSCKSIFTSASKYLGKQVVIFEMVLEVSFGNPREKLKFQILLLFCVGEVLACAGKTTKYVFISRSNKRFLYV